MGDWVEIEGAGFAAEAEHFERYRTAACEHIQHSWTWRTATADILHCRLDAREVEFVHPSWFGRIACLPIG